MDESIGTAQVQVGVDIAYRMRPHDLPTNPQRLWHGIIEEVHPPVCLVRLNEPGYEGLDEMIFFEQIVIGEPFVWHPLRMRYPYILTRRDSLRKSNSTFNFFSLEQ